MKPSRKVSVEERTIRPWFPRLPFTPVVECPHGVVIHRNRICMVCDKAAKTTQAEIDSMPAPPPENPEDRALKQIAFFKQWLTDHPDAPTLTKLHIVRQIYRLEKLVKEWIQPTKYRPDPRLKGGK